MGDFNGRLARGKPRSKGRWIRRPAAVVKKKDFTTLSDPEVKAKHDAAALKVWKAEDPDGAAAAEAARLWATAVVTSLVPTQVRTSTQSAAPPLFGKSPEELGLAKPVDFPDAHLMDGPDGPVVGASAAEPVLELGPEPEPEPELEPAPELELELEPEPAPESELAPEPRAGACTSSKLCVCRQHPSSYTFSLFVSLLHSSYSTGGGGGGGGGGAGAGAGGGAGAGAGAGAGVGAGAGAEGGGTSSKLSVCRQHPSSY
jgi:hypothetical protein